MKNFNSIFLLFILFLGACKPNDNKSQEKLIEQPASSNKLDELISEVQEQNKNIYVAIVDNLRIREVPDEKGAVLGKVYWGQKLIFLGEESEFKEKISLRGKVRYDSWKKVKFITSDSPKEVTGWVYGGGLIKQSEIYKKTSESKYEREIVRATKEEVGELLDMVIDEKFFYDGVIRYKKGVDEKMIKDGKFLLKGQTNVDISKGNPVEISIEISGNYTEGKPNGIFEMKIEGYESTSVITVNYEDGKCLWSSFIGNSEGADYSHREEKPKDCSFKYVIEKFNETQNY